jgi:tetratricopeptide (TPR) repeat protein
MWFQLYIEVLIRMHHKLSDRKELLDLCKNTCKGNNYQLDILNEFEKTYKCENAIWWYTRESCLYRILNKALRFQDYDTLFAFRFFITDIAKQLKNEYEKYIRKTNNRECIHVYRGQFIGNNELELMKKNIGQYLSMNSFFSTSLNRSIALDFINSLPIIDDRQQKILFQIEIDPKLQTKPFVNVTQMSFYKNEDEILIMLGAFFHIKKVFQDKINNMWIAYLSLADDNDYRLKDTFAHMKQKIGEETNLASLGKILFEMGEYDQVEKCYQHMMYDAQMDLSAAYSGLGKAALGKKIFTKAAQYEQESLQIKTSILPKGHRDLAISYSRLGDIYCKQNDHDQALKYLKKAGKIQEKLLPSDPLILAKTYHRIALTCVDMKNYDLAMEFYDKTLQIRKENLPPIDKSIASTYHNIGKLYYIQEKFTQAFKYYNEALDIYKKVLPPKHPNIIRIEQDIETLNKEMKK